MPGGFDWRNALRSLLTVNEGPWRWRAGLEAGLATGIPLILLTLAGYQSLGLIASLGSFAALYYPQLNHVDRAKALILLGLGLIVASLVGVAFASSVWLTVLGVVFVASLACILILGYKVGPPGPLAFILANGVSGHLASPVSLGGAGVEGYLVVLMVAAGVASSLFVIGAPRVLPSVRKREGAARSFGEIFSFLELDKGQRWVVLRVVTAVVLASLVSVPLGIPRAYWVVLTAVAILQATHRVPLTITRAVQRLLGTLGGVLVFMLIARLGPSGPWLVPIVSGLEFMTEVVVAKNYGLALLFITPTALVISTANLVGSPFDVMGERVLDTLLGALVAMAVLFATVWLSVKLKRRS